eukprot:846583-Amphidinium_carterae.1
MVFDTRNHQYKQYPKEAGEASYFDCSAISPLSNGLKKSRYVHFIAPAYYMQSSLCCYRCPFYCSLKKVELLSASLRLIGNSFGWNGT